MTKETEEQYLKRIDELCKEDNAITEKIDREETKKEIINGIISFDADLVYDTINSNATVFENIAAKFYGYELENIDSESQSLYWNRAAKENDVYAKTLRDLMTSLIRMQKIRR